MRCRPYWVNRSLARVLLGQNTADWDDRSAPPSSWSAGITELEVLHSARSAKSRARLKEALDAHCVWCPMPGGIYRRSRVVQEQLTAKGEHRSADPVGLLVAAAVAEAGLTLLHHDRGFDTIARTTGQPVRTIDLRP